MFKQWKRFYLLMMCVMLALITTACFRDSAEGVGAQPVSQLIPTNTFTPTDIPEPSATPTETVTETPTLPPEPTETATAEDIVNVGNTIPGGTAVAQVPTQTPPDDFALTATALIGQLTLDAAAVATTQAFQAGIGTTPTPLAPPTNDPFLATPTELFQSQPLIPGADCVHQIRAGETLYKLSLAYGVSVGEMANASGITNWNLILVGQRITIPGCGTTGFTPPPTSIPVTANTTSETTAQSALPGSVTTTDSLAAQAHSDILNNAQADIQANALVAQSATGTGTTPLVGTRQYTVQQYDTLFQIAQAHGTTVDAIAALNGITNINSITMGDVLQIP
jgi:LysM repeat protein